MRATSGYLEKNGVGFTWWPENISFVVHLLTPFGKICCWSSRV